jgi:D-amino-acid oxidase
VAAAEQVTVIGAGVSGLATAVVLAEAGLRTRVTAEIPGCTSLGVGAVWGPYLVEPKDNVDRWSRHSMKVFRSVADDPPTDVRVTSGTEAPGHADAPTVWATTLPGFRPCSPDDLPPGFTSGNRFEVPLIDMPVYLAYLRDRLLATGAPSSRAGSPIWTAPPRPHCRRLHRPRRTHARSRPRPPPDPPPARRRHQPRRHRLLLRRHRHFPRPALHLSQRQHLVLGGTAIDGQGDLNRARPPPTPSSAAASP